MYNLKKKRFSIQSGLTIMYCISKIENYHNYFEKVKEHH